MFVYLTIHDSIRYTIQKNQKAIHDTIHDLTTMCSGNLDGRGATHSCIVGSLPNTTYSRATVEVILR